MASDVKPRIKAPETAKPGEVIEIKTLISHPMETGQRKDDKGQTIPRKIIKNFTCTYNGRPAFSADLEPAISANPFIAFYIKADQSGELQFTWTDDDGTVYKAAQKLTVG